MMLIAVTVPRKPDVIVRSGGPAIAMQIGNGRADKVPVRIFDPEPRRLRGRTVICEASVFNDRNHSGDEVQALRLEPTNRKTPTHGVPFIENGRIVIPPLRF